MTTLTIAKREFRSNFDSPLAYVVICGGLLYLGFFFFLSNNGFWEVDRASLQTLFAQAPRGITVVATVVTMKLIAEEKRSGTLEMLITLPVRDWEVIMGKFLGAWGLVLLLIASTALYPLMMFWFPWHLGELDTGPVISGYVGLVFYSAAAVSIGLLLSSLTESQVIAGFLTLIVLASLHAVGQLDSFTKNETVRAVTAFISFDARLSPFTRGMINTRDLVYFLSITIGCLMASFRALERRKWA